MSARPPRSRAHATGRQQAPSSPAAWGTSRVTHEGRRRAHGQCRLFISHLQVTGEGGLAGRGCTMVPIRRPGDRQSRHPAGSCRLRWSEPRAVPSRVFSGPKCTPVPRRERIAHSRTTRGHLAVSETFLFVIRWGEATDAPAPPPPRRAWELCLSPPPSPSPGCSGSGPAPQETGRHRAGVSPILFLDFARLCFVFCRKRARFVSVPRSAAMRGQKRRPACPPARPALAGVLVPGRAPPPPRARLRPLSTVSTPRQDRPSPHGPALVPTTTLQPAGLR